MKRQRMVAVVVAVLSLGGAWLALEGVLGIGLLDRWAFGQGRRVLRPPIEDQGTAAQGGRVEQVRLPRDRNAERKLEEAQRLIQEKEWRQAIELLQSMLDEKEDRFLQDAQGRWASVRSEANRLLASMGQEGLRYYEQYYGAQARAMLKEALQNGDLHKLAEVAIRYLHTEAGGEAVAALGTVQLDYGSPVMAALYFERLLKRAGSARSLPTLTLVKAAFAFERAGQEALRDQVWEELQRRDWERELPEALAQLGKRQVRELASATSQARATRERFDWPLFGGDLCHTAVSEGTAPYLESVYELPTYRDARARSEIENAVRMLERRGVVLPGGIPASYGDMVFFRTTFGLHAIRASTGELLWRSAEYENNLESLLISSNRAPDVDNLLNQYRTAGHRAFVYNTLLGTLSLDNERAYMVEDTPVPPIVPRRNMPLGFGPGFVPGNLANAANGNNLAAVHLAGGRLAWLIEGAKSDPNSPLSETFFLGPPLPLGGKLYVLAESNGEIRLVCLEPSTGAVQWLQPLCFVERRASEEPERRMEACHLAYSDGILVCPTNAGIVLGVDLLSRALIWAQPYESNYFQLDDGNAKQLVVRPYGRMVLMEPKWYYSAPMIAQGKIVFTAPDTKYLYCLNLQDGTNAWGPIPQEAGDLYVAGIYHGRILIVGRDRVRALSLADGKPLWSVAVPTPAGRGVANATSYFLPTRTGQVVAISLQDGSILGTSQSQKKEPLGNLLFHNGYVLSQGPTNLVAYPQLAVRQAEIARALEKNPKDPQALTERAVLRLHGGEIEGAVADLRLALKQDMPYELRRRAQQKLFDALSIQLTRNFAAHEDSLAEYEQLVNIPEPPAGENEQARAARLAEQTQRRAKYLLLLARGRESQGRLREAFQAYLALGKLEVIPNETLPGDSTTQTNPPQYAEARLLEILQKAQTEAQRREILDLVHQEWQRVQQSANIEELSRFVALLGQVPEVGLQARLLLANRYLASGDIVNAEYTLLVLAEHEDSRTAALGLEALAKLHAQSGHMQSAIFYYTQLAERYPDIPLSDGKTGRQLLDELAADKRFLPFLDSGKRTWLPSRSPINHRVESGTFPRVQFVRLEMDDIYSLTGRMYSLAIVLNQFPPQLRVYERSHSEETDQPVRVLPLDARNVSFSIGVNNAYRAARCQAVGSMVFFTWGADLYALDLNRKAFAWKRNLLQDALEAWPQGMQPHIYWDPSAGDWTVNYPDGTRERVFSQFVATSQYVAYYSKERGLILAEPRTGRVLWEKRLGDPPVDLFGDSNLLCVVTGNDRGANAQRRGLVLSARSGEFLTVPDFLPAWEQRKAIVGRHLLLAEPDPNGGEVWRLYDVATGRNIWSRRVHNVIGQAESLVPGTVARLVLSPRAEGDDRAGELTPHLLVLDARTGRQLVLAELPEGAALQRSDAYVLADDFHWYLAYNKSNQVNRGGVIALPNGRQVFPHGTILRTVYVEGPLVAWDRVSGRLRWKTELPLQSLILERFEELPIIICASWQRTPVDNQNRRFMDVSLVHAVDKRNGKLIECETVMRNQFQDIVVNRQRGTVELRAGNFNVIFEVGDPAEGANADNASDARTQPRIDGTPGQGPAAQPVVPNPPIRIIQPGQIQPVPVPIVPNPAVPPGAPKIQIQIVPAIPQPQPDKPAPAPANPKVVSPDQPKEKPAAIPAKPVERPPAAEMREGQVREVRERLQKLIQELNRDGQGIDREQFEEIRKTIEQLRRLQEEETHRARPRAQPNP